MQKFKRKSLYLALVAAVSSVGIANTASAAVHVNSNGLGEVLIYPYYTTRAGTDTYLSVVNTTNSSKAVKVRFTEGRIAAKYWTLTSTYPRMTCGLLRL
ncbi:MAG: hypothetical protein IPP36_12020 [Nitrosomonadales bacterium]|nr:hypothetical protein [Nitrosomonadales bacterium]